MSSSAGIPDPSLSQPLPPSKSVLQPLHTLHRHGDSVLSLAADDSHIYTGSQCQDISVWDKNTYAKKASLIGHSGSVLALECAYDKQWLFSASGDSTIRIWCTGHLELLYVIDPYQENAAGDIFCLAWSSTLQTIFFGCQNTSLQWFNFTDMPIDAQITANIPSTESGRSTPSKSVHKFFNSYPQYQRKPADIYAMNGYTTPPISVSGSEGCIQLPSLRAPRAALQVSVANVIESEHFGYIYCMVLLPSTRTGSDDTIRPDDTRGIQLATGSGDETVKLWDCETNPPSLVHTFDCCHGAVLSLVARNETIYAGCQDGYVKVWDLETKTLVRTIMVRENVDVLSLSMLHSDLYTCSADGWVNCYSHTFDRTASWPAHNGIILSSIITRHKSHDATLDLVTGGNDNNINIWAVSPPETREDASHVQNWSEEQSVHDTLVFALSKFVSIRSVSSLPSCKEDCRQAAIWLKKCLHQLGAESCVGINPLVLATFHGAKGDRPNPRILFYGHYDVISAPPKLWNSDPFLLTGRNGYLYGRGATDNKGPIMAVACAAAELLKERALAVDLVFLVEGEEECGSNGFEEAVKKHKERIGPIDVILISNSSWISQSPPCITYGLRGVAAVSVEISSNGTDLHSGIEGGAVAEPMTDMIQVLARLIDGQRRVLVPGFYDDVQPLTESERQLYSVLSTIIQRPPSSLTSRWREPSLTVHSIEVSGPRNSTVIPATVKAQVSVRIVPAQKLEVILNSLCDHLKASFKNISSPNEIHITVERTADWWLGDLNDPCFKALEKAIQDEWGEEPLRIREGGSIPSIPYLEKEFSCRALHLPLGQSSDQAHLPNECISLENLHRGKSVVKRFLLSVIDAINKSSKS